MPIKVGFVSLGCAKNQIDTEYMLGAIKKNKKFDIVSDENLADVIVINTCAFIQSAKEEAINTILEFCKKKEQNLKSVVVTGCLAQRYKEEILKNIPEVDAVIGINSQALLEIAIERSLKKEKVELFKNIKCSSDHKERFLTTPSHYAYLKIAEGCNNFCSYCAIPKIRGKYVSEKPEKILKEAKWLEEKEIKELILIAQDTTYYGYDLKEKFRLEDLLRELSTFNFKWIRFLYAYPERITLSLIETIKESKNILPYFDIPIQHINDDILKNMNRKTNKKQILEKINLIRKNIENATLRTSLIVGFPGETQKQFKELLNFVKEAKFDRLGCFSYSQEEGTKAALLEDQIEDNIKEKRKRDIYKISEKILKQKALSEVDSVTEVIIDQKINTYMNINMYKGRTKKDAPDVDCCVFFSSEKELKVGNIVNIYIKGIDKNSNLFGILN